MPEQGPLITEIDSPYFNYPPCMSTRPDEKKLYRHLKAIYEKHSATWDQESKRAWFLVIERATLSPSTVTKVMNHAIARSIDNDTVTWAHVVALRVIFKDKLYSSKKIMRIILSKYPNANFRTFSFSETYRLGKREEVIPKGAGEELETAAPEDDSLVDGKKDEMRDMKGDDGKCEVGKASSSQEAPGGIVKTDLQNSVKRSDGQEEGGGQPASEAGLEDILKGKRVSKESIEGVEETRAKKEKSVSAKGKPPRKYHDIPLPSIETTFPGPDPKVPTKQLIKLESQKTKEPEPEPDLQSPPKRRKIEEPGQGIDEALRALEKRVTKQDEGMKALKRKMAFNDKEVELVKEKLDNCVMKGRRGRRMARRGDVRLEGGL